MKNKTSQSEQYVLFFIRFWNCSDCVVFFLFIRFWNCFDWEVLFFIRFEKQNIPQSEQFQNLMKNKTCHTVKTVPKSNEKQNIPQTEQFQNLMKNKTLFFIRFWNCSDCGMFRFSLDFGTVLTVWDVLFFIRFWNCSVCGMFCFSLDFGTVLNKTSHSQNSSKI
jgi:hypothetical protein